MLMISLSYLSCDNREYTDDIVGIRPISFEMSLTSQNPEIYFNDSCRIRFKLNPEFVSDINPNTFKVLYTLTGGEGTIYFRGKKYVPGDEIIIDYPDFPVDDDQVYFKPAYLEDKSYTINFSARDNTDASSTAALTINIKQREFEFTALKLTKEKLYAKETKGKIKLNISTLGNPVGMGYNLSFTVSGTGEGTMFYKDIEYLTGQAIPIDSGESEIEYMPENSDSGKHKIILTVKDATGLTKQQEVEFDIYRNPTVNSLTIKKTFDDVSCWFNNCDFRSVYYIDYNIELEEGVKLSRIVITGISCITGNPVAKELINLHQYPNPNTNVEFHRETNPDPDETWSVGTTMEIVIIDANNKETTYNTIVHLK
ncbi:MAG: hypothetical protein LBQ13_04730 [Endomicrobium sp.]|nr:hypothetical protein [Endomicrobium sp.]